MADNEVFRIEFETPGEPVLGKRKKSSSKEWEKSEESIVADELFAYQELHGGGERKTVQSSTVSGKVEITFPDDEEADVTQPDDGYADVTQPDDGDADVTQPDDDDVTLPEDEDATVMEDEDVTMTDDDDET